MIKPSAVTFAPTEISPVQKPVQCRYMNGGGDPPCHFTWIRAADKWVLHWEVSEIFIESRSDNVRFGHPGFGFAVISGIFIISRVPSWKISESDKTWHCWLTLTKLSFGIVKRALTCSMGSHLKHHFNLTWPWSLEKVSRLTLRMNS